MTFQIIFHFIEYFLLCVGYPAHLFTTSRFSAPAPIKMSWLRISAPGCRFINLFYWLLWEVFYQLQLFLNCFNGSGSLLIGLTAPASSKKVRIPAPALQHWMIVLIESSVKFFVIHYRFLSQNCYISGLL